VIERDNFPTDRYIVESLAAQRGLSIRWVEESGDGLTVETLQPHLDRDVAVVIASAVDYRSAAITDVADLTEAAHDVGALTVWDVCHAVGSIPLDFTGDGVDLAVGCTYKYLNGGPGAPAFTYVRSDLGEALSQPIWGWWGRADMFDMPQGYLPYSDIRAWLTGTPGVLSMVGVEAGVAVTVRAGMDAIRLKSTALTSLAIDLFDAWLEPLGMGLASPRDPARRGSHVTVTHPDSSALVERLTSKGVLPDFRRPDGIRIGLAPLTTRYSDVYDGLAVLESLLSE
jgi:kynureninase